MLWIYNTMGMFREIVTDFTLYICHETGIKVNTTTISYEYYIFRESLPEYFIFNK